jgi:predicted ester cyclase
MTPEGARDALRPLRAAMADFAEGPVRAALARLVAPDAVIHLCHPFGDLTGAGFFDATYAPLLAALPDLERRDDIVMAGRDGDGAVWAGTAGHYTGTFARPFLDIPATGRAVHLRFHEFWRFDGPQVVEVQAIWDIPALMMQAGAWPMAPSLGVEWHVPGPATQDGLREGPWDAGQSAATATLVVDMLTAMVRHPREPAAAMDLPRFWDARMMWYGPAGIGTMRGIDGFRRDHQIPFLAAMPDRGQRNAELTSHLFGDGPYAAVTGWPDMRQTLSGGGWLGLPATGEVVDLRSLDFWRIQNGKIRENWVMVDLLDLYRQVGLDPLARMRAMTGPAR